MNLEAIPVYGDGDALSMSPEYVFVATAINPAAAEGCRERVIQYQQCADIPEARQRMLAFMALYLEAGWWALDQCLSAWKMTLVLANDDGPQTEYVKLAVMASTVGVN